MTTTPLHPLAAAYLEELRHAGRRLPRSVMRDLLAEAEAHLSRRPIRASPMREVLTALDRLGDPKEIIAAQQPAAVPQRVRGLHEWAAIFLLLFGGLAGSAYLGLFAASAGGQECSNVSSGVTQCTAGPTTRTEVLAHALRAVVLLAPIATAIYLARRAR